MSPSPVSIISFDCYGTLIAHRDPRARDEVLREYLRDQGLDSRWDVQSLYALFASVSWDESDARARWRALTSRLFEQAGVAKATHVESHQEAVEGIFGPSAFTVYPEVVPVLKRLEAAGYGLAVLSNWPDGLSHYLDALGLAHHFQAIVTSSGEGLAKPDPRIFAALARRLEVPTDRVVHVGDDYESDVEGALAAKMRAVHLDRHGEAPEDAVPTIRTLEGLLTWLVDQKRGPR